MRLVFKIFWKIALAVATTLGLLIIIAVTVAGYISQLNILNEFLTAIGLDSIAPIIQSHGYYLAAGGTIFLIIFAVAGIIFSILESRRIKKYKKAYKQVKQASR